jgi:uncharacterized protein YxjI
LTFCTSCGKEIPQDAAFCAFCGRQTTSKVAGAQNAGFTPTAVTGGSTLLNTKEIVMKRKLMSAREHYDIEDRSGRKIGEGEGNFVQVPARFIVSEVSDSSAKTEVMHIDGKLLSLRHQFTLYDGSGNLLGELKKKIAKLIGQEYWLEVNGTELMRIFGNFSQHQYQMTVNGQQVAEVNRKWVSVTNEFGLSITGDVDPRIVIGSAVVIEHLETQPSGFRIR